MSEPVRIALRLPEVSYSGRIRIGALREAHARRWIVSHGKNGPEFMLRYGMRGIIGGPNDKPAPSLYTGVGIKYVAVLGFPSPGCTATVTLEHERIGQLAGEHLVECGFRNFGFVGYARHGAARRRGFEQAVRHRARSFSVCPVVYHNTTEDFDAMAAWLLSLQKPVAVFAADDPIGCGVTEVCHLRGIRIPADIAVVAVNDDGIHTIGSEPPLSSVKLPWELVGAEAVKVLAAHMENDPNAPSAVVVGPVGVAVRASSDINVIGDHEVAAASAFIRQHHNRDIGVRDVVDATTISRRLLEQRFKGETGRTLLDQIRHVRIERARRMLVETSMRVNDIAADCGFGSRSQFGRVFQKVMGVTPEDYRRKGEADITTSRDLPPMATGI